MNNDRLVERETTDLTTRMRRLNNVNWSALWS